MKMKYNVVIKNDHWRTVQNTKREVRARIFFKCMQTTLKDHICIKKSYFVLKNNIKKVAILIRERSLLFERLIFCAHYDMYNL